jgi:ribosome-associated protein
MIRILDGLSIPEGEISFTASRSGGPGGQNVNKVSSRVTLSFDVAGSAFLSGEQKHKIRSRLATRINKDGVLRIVSQRTRSQEMNRADAMERFADLVRRALTPTQPRIKTRPPAAAKARRVDEKKKRSAIKEGRSKISTE